MYVASSPSQSHHTLDITLLVIQDETGDSKCQACGGSRSRPIDNASHYTASGLVCTTTRGEQGFRSLSINLPPIFSYLLHGLRSYPGQLLPSNFGFKVRLKSVIQELD